MPKNNSLTIQESFKYTLDLIQPALDKIDDPDTRHSLLHALESMRALVEAHGVMEQMLEASLSNFQMAINQRDYALKSMTLWQEEAIKQTITAASEFTAREVLEGTRPKDVAQALKRALGFDIGVLPPASIMKFFEAIDEMTAHIEQEGDIDDQQSA